MPREKESLFSLNLRLPEPMHRRLDEVRQARGKNSVQEVALEAIDGYLRTITNRAGLERLTPRQREILQMVAEGHKTKEIAAKLGISIKTIEMHRANLMETLKLRNIAGLVRFAVRAGVVNP